MGITKMRKEFFTALLFFVSAGSLSLLYAQETTEVLIAPQAVIKLSNPIHNIIWSNDSSLFAFSEGDNIILADSETNAISEMIHTGGTVRQVQVARNQSAENEQLLILSGNNSVMLHALRKGAKNVYQSHSNAQVTSIAFDDTGKYIAMGLAGGNITVGWQLQFSGELSNKTVTGHTTGPYTMSFSPDSKYIATGADDGTIRVVRLQDYKTVNRETFANYVHAPVIFSADSTSVFCAVDECTVKRIAVTGATWMTENKMYTVDSKILSFALSADNKQLIILTEDQEFKFFDIETQEFTGFIPRLAKGEIADFAFSQNNSQLLIGYKDGAIVRIEVNEYWRKAGSAVKVIYEQYMSDGGSGGIGPGNGGTGLISYGYPLPPTSKLDYVDISASLNSLGILAEPGAMPYNLNIIISNQVLHNLESIPFYAGLGISFSLAFPDHDFPFNYSNSDGNSIQSPYLITGNITPVFGYEYQVSPGFALFTQLQLGLSGNLLWSPGIAKSGLMFSGNSGISAGVIWNGFKVHLNAYHDSATGFSAGGGISFRIALHEGDAA